MALQIHTHLLPVLFEPDELRGGSAVVVDILRASTTMSFALANGAKGVMPCGSVDVAIHLRTQLGADRCLLGGERGGVKIEGFDLSNSPDDYGAEVIARRTIGFTTTNGTNALLRSNKAKTVIVGAFSNLSAVVNRLRRTESPIHIVCAGTNGAITSEDVLFAGALTAKLIEKNPTAKLTDSTQLALNHWREECNMLSSEKVEAALRRSQGGKNLIRLSYDKDITTAATIDAVNAVGIVDGSGVVRCS